MTTLNPQAVGVLVSISLCLVFLYSSGIISPQLSPVVSSSALHTASIQQQQQQQHTNNTGSVTADADNNTNNNVVAIHSPPPPRCPPPPRMIAPSPSVVNGTVPGYGPVKIVKPVTYVPGDVFCEGYLVMLHYRLLRHACSTPQLQPPCAGLALDIGVNRGWYSLYFAALGCDVIGFDPLPLMPDDLYTLNGVAPYISFHKAVVSAVEGNTAMRASPSDPNGFVPGGGGG